MSTTPIRQSDPPYVAASMLRSLLHFFEQQALDTAQLVRQAGITDGMLADRERLIPGHHYAELMQAGIAEANNPLLGLAFGMAVEPDRWGMLGVLLTHCNTIAEAIEFQRRFQTLVSTVGHARLQAAPPDMVLSWAPAVTTLPALTEEALAAWVNFGRWATGRLAAPRIVTFSHAAQGPVSAYGDFFQCPVRFEQPQDALFFAPEMLNVPLRSPDPQLKQWLVDRAQRLQRELLDDDIRSRLAHWLAKQLPFGMPERADAARALGLSERALQDELERAGTHFKACITDVRRELADYYLRDPGLSIGDIALMLGFSEQSAFQRAFKRWHGLTPRAYQKRLP